MAERPASMLSIALCLCIVLEEGDGAASLDPQQAAPGGRHLLRSKRCSCNSWLDKECIYFCHLDIIWVNTPGHTIPYGLGNPPKRRKRSLGRCECSSARDVSCASFCQSKPRYRRNNTTQEDGTLTAKERLSRQRQQRAFLRVLRDAAISNSFHLRRQLRSSGSSKVAVWKRKR